MNLRRLGLAASLWCVAGVAPAGAEERPQDLPRLLFLGVEPTSNQIPALVPRRVAERIAADLAADPSLILLSVIDDPADAAAAPPAPPLVDRGTEASAMISLARASLQAQDAPGAEQHARAAIEALVDSPAAIGDFTPLIDAHVLLGEALAEQKQEAAARAVFRQVLALAPGTPPDAKKLGKRAQKLWTQAKREFDKLERGSVQVQVTPPEATAIVSVDGAVSGEAPVLLLDLGAGWHIVQVRAEGFRPFGAHVDVSPGETDALEVTLEPTVAPPSAPDAVRSALRAEVKKRAHGGVIDAGTKPILGRLAERVGATHLLVALLSPADGGGYTLRTFLFRADGARLVELDAALLDPELLELEARTLQASRGASSAIRRFPEGRDITTSITTVGPDATDDGRKGLIGDGRRRDPVRERDDELPPPIWKNTWFWVGVAGVVVGGVALGWAIASSTSADGYDGVIVLP